MFEEEATISPIRNATGNITNFVAVKRDVTREVALENQLRQSQKMEAIGQLAGGIAHDFNNLLTAIHANAAQLLTPPLTPWETAECSQQILEAAERAATLTRQLLMFSRKQIMQPVTSDLNDIVAQTAKMLQRILGEDISLVSEPAANLPAVQADTGMIEQILLNLAVNSRDAMPKGGKLVIATGTELLDEKQASRNAGTAPGLMSGSPSRTPAAAFPPKICPASLSRSSPPRSRARAPAWAWPPFMASSSNITAGSPSTAKPAWAPPSASISRPVAGKKTGKAAGPGILKLPRGKELILLVEDELTVRAARQQHAATLRL